MMRKYVGDKCSIEATSHDGKKWEVSVFDRGHVTKYTDTTEPELKELAVKKAMKLAVQR